MWSLHWPSHLVFLAVCDAEIRNDSHIKRVFVRGGGMRQCQSWLRNCALACLPEPCLRMRSPFFWVTPLTLGFGQDVRDPMTRAFDWFRNSSVIIFVFLRVITSWYNGYVEDFAKGLSSKFRICSAGSDCHCWLHCHKVGENSTPITLTKRLQLQGKTASHPGTTRTVYILSLLT